MATENLLRGNYRCCGFSWDSASLSPGAKEFAPNMMKKYLNR